MNNNGMLKPALIAGALAGIVSAIPGLKILNCFCCAWVIAGGVFAAHLYVKESLTAVTLGSGVLLGLITGVVAGIVETLFSIPIHFAMRDAGAAVIEQMQQVLEKVPNVPSETKEILESLARRGLGLFVLVIGGVITTFIYAVVGMLGGAVGVAVFEKRKPGEPGAAPPVYQPPSSYPPPPPVDVPPGPGENQSS